MNIIAIVILSFILFEFFIHAVGDVLNLSMMKEKPPSEVNNIFNEKEYEKSCAYLKTNTEFGWVTQVFDLTVFILFWFMGGFRLLQSLIEPIGLDAVNTGVLYIGCLLALKALLSLPFEIYETFVIEERFGFNKTTLKTFMSDRLKGSVLAVLLGGPLLFGILAFFNYAEKNAWWMCWLAVTAFILAVQYVAPTWIMPLFNKFTPLENGELKRAILGYAESVNFPIKNVFVMDGSKRSSKSNAFFTGFGKNRRIALFDTLIEKLEDNELIAVLAHEAGHYRKKHILMMMLAGIVQTGATFYLLEFVIRYQPLFDAFYMDKPTDYAGLIFFGMLYGPISFLIGLLMGAISRSHEFNADRFAAETTKDPGALINALTKISAENLSNLNPHPFYVKLNYSHPPVLSRIRALSRGPYAFSISASNNNNARGSES